VVLCISFEPALLHQLKAGMYLGAFTPGPFEGEFFCGKQKKILEIWSKAQRESARRPKFDWGTV